MSLLGTLRLNHASPSKPRPNGRFFIICHGGIKMLKSYTSMDYPISYLKLPVQTHLTVKGNFIHSKNQSEAFTSLVYITISLVDRSGFRASSNRICTTKLTFRGFINTSLVMFAQSCFRIVKGRAYQILVD